jgi:NHLM bacteriocin system ABC transporter ATP-binding protein
MSVTDGMPTRTRAGLAAFCASVGVKAPKSIALDDADQVCFVARGFVDIFIVPIRQGKSIGQRLHLMRVREGELFFGLRPTNTQTNVMLLAIAAGDPQVVKLPTAQLANCPVEDVAPAIERWVQMLAPHAFAGVDATADGRELVAGVSAQLTAGDVVQVGQRVAWVHVTPALTPVGLEEAPWRQEMLVPLTRGMCLRATADTAVTSYATATVLGQRNGLAHLQGLHALVVAALCHAALLREREERRWIAERDDSEGASLDAALRKLAAVEVEERAVVAAGSDPVEVACAHVAAALDVQLTPVPPGPGSAIERVDTITRKNRIRTRQVMLTGEWWKRDCGPILAFAEDDVPVALVPSGPTSYRMKAGGVDVPVDAAVASRLQRSALVFYRALPDVIRAADVARFALAGTRADVAMVVVTGMAMGVFGTLLPLASGQIFDTIIPGAQRGALLQLAAGLVLFSLASAALSVTRSIALLRIETRMSSALEAAVWDRLLALPVAFFKNYSSGDLADRANGINVIRSVISGTVLSSIASSVFGLWNLVLLFFYDVKLALLGTALAGFAAVVAFASAMLEIRYQREVLQQNGYISGMVMQLISGVAKLRNAAAEARAFARWVDAYARLRATTYRARMLTARVSQFEGFYPVLVLLVLYTMVGQMPPGQMSTGAFLAFQAALMGYTASLLGMVSDVVSLLQVVPQFERAKEILSTASEMDSTRAHPGKLDGRIEVSHLTFRYVAGQAPTLDDVSLSVEPGEFVAVVGPSGSGKSSLLRCLLGFEKPESGGVYYSGQDLQKVDPREVRRQLGVVLQGNELMAGSLQENIAGANLLSTQEAWAALEMAALADEVRAMPMGLHTVVTEGGGTLSGGQRQRLLIARAVAKKPKILFFDEATSALDAKSQDQVMKALNRLRVTRVVIAHRLSTIRDADKIVVLERGRVVEQGTYAQLMARKGTFAELARRQVAET